MNFLLGRRRPKSDSRTKRREFRDEEISGGMNGVVVPSECKLHL